MTVNSSKFHYIIIDYGKTNYYPLMFNTEWKEIKSLESVSIPSLEIYS